MLRKREKVPITSPDPLQKKIVENVIVLKSGVALSTL